MAKVTSQHNSETTTAATFSPDQLAFWYFKNTFGIFDLISYATDGLSTMDAVNLATFMVCAGAEVTNLQSVKDYYYAACLEDSHYSRVSEPRFMMILKDRLPRIQKDLSTHADKSAKNRESGQKGGLAKAANRSEPAESTPEAPKTATTAPTAQTALKTAFKPNVDLEDYSDEVAKVAKLFNEIYCLPGMGSRTITVADMNKIDHALSWDVEASDFMQSLQIHKLAIVGAKEKDQDSKKLWIPGIEKYIDDQRYDIKTTADRINWKTILQARQRECEEFS